MDTEDEESVDFPPFHPQKKVRELLFLIGWYSWLFVLTN
jgi:hypothetical protein